MVDKKDITILNELKKDAWRTKSTIAKSLNMKRTTFLYHVNEMIKNEIIKKICVVPNYKKIGRPVTVFLLISFKSGDINSDGKTEVSQKKLAKRIARLDNVYEVHIVTGEYDLLVKARGKSLEEIGKLVVDKLRLLKGVDKSYTLACFQSIMEKI